MKTAIFEAEVRGKSLGREHKQRGVHKAQAKRNTLRSQFSPKMIGNGKKNKGEKEGEKGQQDRFMVGESRKVKEANSELSRKGTENITGRAFVESTIGTRTAS